MPRISTSTPSPSDLLEEALKGVVDSKLRSKLITNYLAIKKNFAEGRFDAAGADAGKFCEVAIRVAQLQATGAYVPLGTRIPTSQTLFVRWS
jgi:hypothetical protein